LSTRRWERFLHDDTPHYGSCVCCLNRQMGGELSVDGWVIDSYGLRVAHSKSLFDQLRDTDRLHVSPLTWHPGDAAGVGGRLSLTRKPTPATASQLALVDGDISRTRDQTAILDARLRELHDQGVLILAGEHECARNSSLTSKTAGKPPGLCGDRPMRRSQL
jgi:hypothetical protein